MPSKYIFTITTGRSGTAYLAELLRQNVPGIDAHHEFIDYDSFGHDTPDVSDMMQFNAFGNNSKVRRFWEAKLARIGNIRSTDYAETSHMLSKAGLLENISRLPAGGDVYMILLRRDIASIVTSLAARNDFANKGNAWLWYLDPGYPRNIINASGFLKLGKTGVRIWYVYEMLTRAEYYRQLLVNVAHVHFVDVELEELITPDQISDFLRQLGYERQPAQVFVPEPQNASATPHLPTDLASTQEIVDQIPFSPEALAAKFLDAGRRIGTADGFDDYTQAVTMPSPHFQSNHVVQDSPPRNHTPLG